MLEYRCGNCKRKLIAGSTFCTNCEVFFELPVPTGVPASPGMIYVKPGNISALRSARAFRGFAVAVCAVAATTLAIVFNGYHLSLRDLSCVPTQSTSIRECMQADDDAHNIGTLGAYVHAMDMEVRMSSGCSVRHCPQPSKWDRVTLVLPGGIGPKKARSRAWYAMFLYTSTRALFMSRDEAQCVSVSLYDIDGRRMAYAAGGA